MLKIYSLAILLVFLLLTPVASAGTRLSRSRHVAYVIYGPVCHGDVRITYRPLPPQNGLEAAGEAEWMAVDLNDPSTFSNCKIVLNSNLHYTYRELCATFVHEWGHLYGLEHSTNPYSVMYPHISRKNIPNSCK